MKNNNDVLNSHFRDLQITLLDPPDTLASPRADLAISSFQCDASSSYSLTYAVTIRNVGLETSLIPANPNGSTSNSLVLGFYLSREARLTASSIRPGGVTLLNTHPANTLEIASREDLNIAFSATFSSGHDDYNFAIAVLKPRDYPLYVPLGNNVAIIPLIRR